MRKRDALYQRAVQAKEAMLDIQEYEAASVIRDLLKLCQRLENLEGKKRRKKPKRVPLHSQ